MSVFHRTGIDFSDSFERSFWTSLQALFASVSVDGILSDPVDLGRAAIVGAVACGITFLTSIARQRLRELPPEQEDEGDEPA